MGYTTEFFGALTFNKPVDEELKNYVNKFCGVRHMNRDTDIIKQVYPEWEKMCYRGNLGPNGEYFINDDNAFGQAYDKSILDYNTPPITQPGLWCKWEITEDGQHLQWDGMEKFYNYVEWLEYLISVFFEPNGYFLNGVLKFIGEDFDDRGYIIVRRNCIEQMYTDVPSNEVN